MPRLREKERERDGEKLIYATGNATGVRRIAANQCARAERALARRTTTAAAAAAAHVFVAHVAHLKCGHIVHLRTGPPRQRLIVAARQSCTFGNIAVAEPSSETAVGCCCCCLSHQRTVAIKTSSAGGSSLMVTKGWPRVRREYVSEYTGGTSVYIYITHEYIWYISHSCDANFRVKRSTRRHHRIATSLHSIVY